MIHRLLYVLAGAWLASGVLALVWLLIVSRDDTLDDELCPCGCGCPMWGVA